MSNLFSFPIGSSRLMLQFVFGLLASFSIYGQDSNQFDNRVTPLGLSLIIKNQFGYESIWLSSQESFFQRSIDIDLSNKKDLSAFLKANTTAMKGCFIKVDDQGKTIVFSDTSFKNEGPFVLKHRVNRVMAREQLPKRLIEELLNGENCTVVVVNKSISGDEYVKSATNSGTPMTINPRISLDFEGGNLVDLLLLISSKLDGGFWIVKDRQFFLLFPDGRDFAVALPHSREYIRSLFPDAEWEK